MSGSVSSQEAARQQIALWVHEAGVACLNRQFIRGIDLYERALERARFEGLKGSVARICRDLSFIYLHHGSDDKALALIDEGMESDRGALDVRLGLLCNRAMVFLGEARYREGFTALDEAVTLFEQEFAGTDPNDRPGEMLPSYASIRYMHRNLKKVVTYLDAGVNPARVEVDFELPVPPWAKE